MAQEQVLKSHWANLLRWHGLSLHATLFTLVPSDITSWVRSILNDSEFDGFIQLYFDKEYMLWDDDDGYKQYVQELLVDSPIDLEMASDRLFILMILLRGQIKKFPREKEIIQYMAESAALYFIECLKTQRRRIYWKKNLLKGFIASSLAAMVVAWCLK